MDEAEYKRYILGSEDLGRDGLKRKAINLAKRRGGKTGNFHRMNKAQLKAVVRDKEFQDYDAN